MKHKAIHDPFHDDQPQVKNVYEYETPPELASIDRTAGGKNVRPVLIEDPHHHSRFVPTQEPEHTFFKKGGK
jgi:hypothetical protein